MLNCDNQYHITKMFLLINLFIHSLGEKLTNSASFLIHIGRAGTRAVKNIGTGG